MKVNNNERRLRIRVDVVGSLHNKELAFLADDTAMLNEVYEQVSKEMGTIPAEPKFLNGLVVFKLPEHGKVNVIEASNRRSPLGIATLRGERNLSFLIEVQYYKEFDNYSVTLLGIKLPKGIGVHTSDLDAVYCEIDELTLVMNKELPNHQNGTLRSVATELKYGTSLMVEVNNITLTKGFIYGVSRSLLQDVYKKMCELKGNNIFVPLFLEGLMTYGANQTVLGLADGKLKDYYNLSLNLNLYIIYVPEHDSWSVKISSLKLTNNPPSKNAMKLQKAIERKNKIRKILSAIKKDEEK